MGGGGGPLQPCKETLKVLQSPIIKPTPLSIPGLPPFLVKIPHSPITAIFQKLSSPSLNEGGRGFPKTQNVYLWYENFF